MIKSVEHNVIQSVKQKVIDSVKHDVIHSDKQNLEKAIADHPKLKAIEAKLNELKDSFEGIYHRFYKKSDDNDVFAPLMTEKAETKYFDSEATKKDPSEDSLEGGLNDFQVSQDLKEEKPLEKDISEDNPNPPLEDISEKPTTTGIEDNGSDEVETAIADKTDQGLTDKELADLLAKQGKKTTFSTVNRWRNQKSKPSGKNKDLFKEWKVRGDRWFPKN